MRAVDFTCSSSIIFFPSYKLFRVAMAPVPMHICHCTSITIIMLQLAMAVSLFAKHTGVVFISCTNNESLS